MWKIKVYYWSGRGLRENLVKKNLKNYYNELKLTFKK
jgi:hypothetical protein